MADKIMSRLEYEAHKLIEKEFLHMLLYGIDVQGNPIPEPTEWEIYARHIHCAQIRYLNDDPRTHFTVFRHKIDGTVWHRYRDGKYFDTNDEDSLIEISKPYVFVRWSRGMDL